MSRARKMRGNFTSETTSNYEAGGKMWRLCVFCGEWKPITDYAKNGTDANGNTRWREDCKQCYNIRRRENRTKGRHTSFVGSCKRRGEEEPDYTHQEWKECVIFFGGECAYCGCTPRKGQRLTRDHLQPVSLGGLTTQDNIIPACGSCNSSKGARDFKDWYMKQAFFSQERLNKIFKWRTIMRMIGGERDE